MFSTENGMERSNWRCATVCDMLTATFAQGVAMKSVETAILLLSFCTALSAEAVPVVIKHGSGGGTFTQTCPGTKGVTGCIFGVRVSDASGNPIDVTDPKGKSFRDGVIPPFPKFSNMLAPGASVTFIVPSLVDVKDPRGGSMKEIVEDILNITDIFRSPSARADVMIEAVAFDPNTGSLFINNIFSVIAEHVGLNASIFVPDMFADTNGNGTIGQGDVLYSVVDLYKYLGSASPFSVGQTFNIVDGVASGLPGMMFSTTPFTFDPSIGFVGGTLFNGVGQADTLHDMQALPTPSTLALLGASVLGLIGGGLARRCIAAMLPAPRDGRIQA